MTILRDAHGRRRGPWWMALIAVVVGLLALRAIRSLGPEGPPATGDWVASDGTRLELRDDGTSTLTAGGRREPVNPWWEPPHLRLERQDGPALLLRHEEGELRPAEGPALRLRE